MARGITGVLHGSDLGPVLFNKFMNYLDVRTECFLSKSVDSTKLGMTANTLENYIQKHLD